MASRPIASNFTAGRCLPAQASHPREPFERHSYGQRDKLPAVASTTFGSPYEVFLSSNRRKDCRSPKMSGLFGGPSTSAASSNTVGDLKQDVEVQQPPTDGITDLSFNPNQSSQQDFLTVASWDKKVRLYEVTPQGQAQPRHAYDHEGPVFSVDWFKVSAHSSPSRPVVYFVPMLTDHQLPGWLESRLRIRRQASQAMRSRDAANDAGGGARAAHPRGALLRGQRHAHDRDRLVGQDRQVLGLQAELPGSYPAVPRARLHHGRAEQPARRGHRRPLHQRRQPRQPRQVLQDPTEPPQVADTGCQLLCRRGRLRDRQYRGKVCDPICGGQGLRVRQMPRCFSLRGLGLMVTC